MKPYSLALPLVLLTTLLSSCALPSSPPKTVTDPEMLSIFHRAKQSDPDALYTIAKCYEKGTRGFPKSTWWALGSMQKAARLGHKTAQAERAYDAYYNNLGTDILKSFEAKAKLHDLAREGNPFAIRAVAEIEEEWEEYRKEQERINCPYCKGSGYDPDRIRVLKLGDQTYYNPNNCKIRCYHCNGTGRKDKKPNQGWGHSLF